MSAKLPAPVVCAFGFCALLGFLLLTVAVSLWRKIRGQAQPYDIEDL